MIKPLNYQKKAIPTSKGWVYKGELLKSKHFSDEDIAEYMANQEVVPVHASPKPEMLREAPANDTALEDMTPRELNEITTQLDPTPKKKKASTKASTKKKSAKTTLAE